MTTVWPILVLGFVATSLLLLPALLKGRWLSDGEHNAQQEETPNEFEPHATDSRIRNNLNWSYLMVYAMLPLTVSLLLLWGASARMLGNNSWSIPLVIILPGAIGAIIARNQQRRGDEGDATGS